MGPIGHYTPLQEIRITIHIPYTFYNRSSSVNSILFVFYILLTFHKCTLHSSTHMTHFYPLKT